LAYNKLVAPLLLKSRNFSSFAVPLTTDILLNELPWFITGFSDAECCFHIGIYKNNRLKTNFEVQHEFKIELHIKEISLLKLIRDFFGVGKITQQGNKAVYRVKPIKELMVIISHFDKYPLITQKWADFELFKSSVKLTEAQSHLTLEGLQKIVSLKSSMNRGLSEELKWNFPDVIPTSRPLVTDQKIKNPQWVAGFTTGEGCFFISIYKSKTNVGFGVTLRFKLCQHTRDNLLMKSLVEYLGCGHFSIKSTQNVCDFIVSKNSDNLNKIVPFFDKYMLMGTKVLEFEDFKKALDLIKNNEHLTESGLEKIRLLKSGMNRGRK